MSVIKSAFFFLVVLYTYVSLCVGLCATLQITAMGLARNINAVRFTSDGSRVSSVVGVTERAKVCRLRSAHIVSGGSATYPLSL